MTQETAPVPDGCPLPRSQQTRNLLIFAACISLNYLTAPVSYVAVQPSLCRLLQASDKVANLPLAFYLAFPVVAVVIAWAVPYVSWLRRNLVACFAFTSLSQALVAGALVADISNEWKIAAVVLQSAVAGAMAPAAVAFLWEMIARGVAESRRGFTLGLAFGLGPLFAILSSLAQDVVINGELELQKFVPWNIPGNLSVFQFHRPEFPGNFALLYGILAPLTLLAAVLCGFCVVPLPDREVKREPFLTGVVGGFWNILGNRVLLTATAFTILIYTGNTITTNMNLYTKQALGASPEEYAGVQNAWRFGCKMLAGIFYGWILAKTNPKVALLIPASVFVAAQGWAICAVGPLYLVAFGIYGAGELIGVYAPNYILSASHKADFRRNMAFVNMLAAPAAPAALLFGAISDAYEKTAEGYRLSFALCAAIMAAGVLIAVLFLPSSPRPDKKVEQTEAALP